MDDSIIELAELAIKSSLDKGCDYSDVYAENSILTNIRLTDGKIQHYELGTNAGVGIRVISEGVTGYSFCEGFEPADITRAGEEALKFAQSSHSKPFEGYRNRIEQKGYPVTKPSWESEDSTKIELMMCADETARSVHDAVQQVFVVYRDWHKQFHILNSESLSLKEETSLLEFYVIVITGKQGRFQRSVRAFGGITGLEELNAQKVEELARDAAKSAVLFLDAEPAPVGKMPVVIENGAMGGGVLIHEAIGHALESDYIESGSSLYAGMLGKKIAAPIVTVVDDGTLLPNSGCYYHDDEGTPARKTVLIREGLLEHYMTDILGSKNLGLERTGNGRRENFRFYPIPRMTCTFIDQGDAEPDDIVKEVKSGLYVKTLGGGHGDTSGAGFAFNVAEGFLIENGGITRPVQGATLTGKGMDVLQNTFAIGNDLAHTGVGRCGKIQQVPVSCGQPTIGIRELLVGGTKT